jgi:plastocyanin
VRRVLPLTALVFALPGCGGEDDEAPGRTVTVKSPDTVTVVADEYSFDPETIVVRGTQLVVELENDGSLAHNLRVIEDGSDIGGTPTFTGGQTRTSTIDLHPGEFELVCTVGNHEQLGMTGTLQVE